MNNTLAQQRSAYALNEVKNLKAERESFAKLVSSLPAMILQNGFSQTLAFLLAKSTKDGKINSVDKHFQAFEIIVNWLLRSKIINSNEKATAIHIQSISELPQDKYLQSQEEAMKVLEWVKRYANAGLFSSSGGYHGL